MLCAHASIWCLNFLQAFLRSLSSVCVNLLIFPAPNNLSHCTCSVYFSHVHTHTQPHCRYCDLVTIDCHNDCGHCCQRKDLSSHLASCPNKQEKCHNCSIYFTCNRIVEHQPHCSKLTVPESILSNIYKVWYYCIVHVHVHCTY